MIVRKGIPDKCTFSLLRALKRLGCNQQELKSQSDTCRTQERFLRTYKTFPYYEKSNFTKMKDYQTIQVLQNDYQEAKRRFHSYR